MITAHWWPITELEEKLALHGCRCHHSRALDMFRERPDGITEPLVGAAPQPIDLYRLDHGDPPFMRKDAAVGNP